MKTTNNKLEHNDCQHPQRMWHSCISGKKPCVHLATPIWSIILCVYRMIESNGINKRTLYQPSWQRGPLNHKQLWPCSNWLMHYQPWSFKIGFWKPMFQHGFINLYPHKSLNFNVLRLHITNYYDHHFTIGRMVHMISHNCLIINIFHMIKHDPSVMQISCKLHSCDKADFIPDIIYRHLKNKHILS
jgi:hypothetical protein